MAETINISVTTLTAIAHRTFAVRVLVTCSEVSVSGREDTPSALEVGLNKSDRGVPGAVVFENLRPPAIGQLPFDEFVHVGRSTCRTNLSLFEIGDGDTGKDVFQHVGPQKTFNAGAPRWLHYFSRSDLRPEKCRSRQLISHSAESHR